MGAEIEEFNYFQVCELLLTSILFIPLMMHGSLFALNFLTFYSVQM
jgi:hypothetical protein